MKIIISIIDGIIFSTLITYYIMWLTSCYGNCFLQTSLSNLMPWFVKPTTIMVLVSSFVVGFTATKIFFNLRKK